jgi:biopolymer transport protein ExbB/TolQ
MESLKSEYDAECEELSRAKCDVEEQMSELESRRSQLQAREKELKADEERLEKLRSANAKETEQLLQKQQVELKKSVDREKKRLESIKK